MQAAFPRLTAVAILALAAPNPAAAACCASYFNGGARWRTSGENLLLVLPVMALPAQELGSPANPGRFIAANDLAFIQLAPIGRWLRVIEPTVF